MNNGFTQVLSRSAQKKARRKERRKANSRESNDSGDTISSTSTGASKKEVGIATWNGRGLNNPYKKNEVLRWIQVNKLDIAALVEVKLHENKWNDAVRSCSPDDSWKAEFSNCEGGWARIMLLWNKGTTKIWNIQKFYHFIACEVEADNKRFGLIVVYASNLASERRIMWEEIEKVGDKFSGGWLCIGDFNCVKDQREKRNGSRVNDKDTVDFRRFIDRTGLVDLPASGSHFTWSNNHTDPKDRIWSKLDRALGNPVERRSKSFRYCNFWENLEGYDEIVRSSWSSGNKCRNLFMFQAKMKSLKLIMKQRLVGSARGMDKRVNQSREALLEAQRKSESNPLEVECCITERKMALEFRKVNLLKNRRCRSNIAQVTLEDGTVSTDKRIIQREFSNYFKGLLGRERGCRSIEAEVIAQGPLVSSEFCRSLVRVATDKEIWGALLSIGDDKAPGPDGFSSRFFKKNWEIVGKELCDGVRHCLRHNALPKGMNAAYIALIPKCSQASKPEEFRPISCCNVTYKIISSLLAAPQWIW
ncbi:hypothetical protein QQ045_019157 [Rhodiola kirilowii]